MVLTCGDVSLELTDGKVSYSKKKMRALKFGVWD